MSARDLMIPDRALYSTLDDLARRTIALERRLKFPSSVRNETVVGPTALAGASAYTTVITITLDPGRWVLIGGSQIKVQNVGTTGFASRVRIRCTGSFGTDDFEARGDSTTSTAGAEIYESLTAVGSESRGETITVVLSVMTPGSYTTMQSLNAYLLAVPN